MLAGFHLGLIVPPLTSFTFRHLTFIFLPLELPTLPLHTNPLHRYLGSPNAYTRDTV